MKHLISAFQFLTILPLGKPRTLDASKITPCFPLVGLGIGLILMLADYLFSKLWPLSVISLLDILLLAILSGGLHLDGLGDTADGFFSHKSPERALAIMRDSRIGVMGLLAILFVLAIKWTSLQGVAEHRGLYLIIIPAYSRGSMMFGIKFLSYGRPEGGVGTDFFSRKPSTFALASIFLPPLISLWLGYPAIWLNALFILMTTLILLYFKRRLGCITGDMLGAMAEVEEACLFLVASASLPIFS
ncbi:MAG: adenosylcobinamide-GDP ribazoletransferase [Deltaproteobacteria bacterium]|nr:MAG: adenosylcobinamide-GDP ribazoletransferase [Deltaproteobacteria bacterium]